MRDNLLDQGEEADVALENNVQAFFHLYPLARRVCPLPPPHIKRLGVVRGVFFSARGQLCCPQSSQQMGPFADGPPREHFTHQNGATSPHGVGVTPGSVQRVEREITSR